MTGRAGPAGARLEALIERARANAARETREIARLSSDIGPGVFLSQAESLAQAATALVRYLSALDALEAARDLLEDA